jgi:hypothetical protein
VAWSAARLVRALDRDDVPGGAAIRRAGLCYVVSGVGLLYGHSIGVVGLAIVNLAVLACLVGMARWGRAFLVLCLADLLIAVAFAPFLSIMLAISAQRIGYYWLPPPPSLAAAFMHMHSVANQSLRLPGMLGDVPPILAVLAAFGGFLGCLRLRWTESNRAALLFAAATAFCPIVLFLLSHALTPIFLFKILMALTLPVMIPMIALGLEGLQPVALRIPIAVLAVAAYLIGNLAPHEPREPWNEVAAYVTARLSPQDVVLFWPPYAQWGMDFYVKRPVAEREYLLDPQLHSEFRPFRNLPFIDTAAAARLLAATDHAWIVVDEDEKDAGTALGRLDAMLSLLPDRTARAHRFAMGLMTLEVSTASGEGRRPAP